MINLEKAPMIRLIPALAEKIGLNEAIVLQQIHFRLNVSEKWREGHRWIHKTYGDWQKNEFPFWSVDTVYRTIRKLEEKGLLISTDVYNKMFMDNTKWYRIDYEALAAITSQIAEVKLGKSIEVPGQNEEVGISNVPKPITKEGFKKSLKKKKTSSVEKDLDLVAVIDYLNTKAHKQFKANSKATIRLVKARFQEGYELDDFKKVIDTKVKEWQGKPRWEKYLRPSTLFNATNFENYLEESRGSQSLEEKMQNAYELDFSKGEF